MSNRSKFRWLILPPTINNGTIGMGANNNQWIHKYLIPKRAKSSTGLSSAPCRDFELSSIFIRLVLANTMDTKSLWALWASAHERGLLLSIGFDTGPRPVLGPIWPDNF
ncbi:hypothetical protein CRG98_012967 [Punica granatum]|uniref:Uncharacterized protein n=1 Tax=Punica granatum TaxID=22663 RepID=A0A2I0KDL5_PUNGR|nr:hypothetical protein CRG98_012967 [Punica granatum]